MGRHSHATKYYTNYDGTFCSTTRAGREITRGAQPTPPKLHENIHNAINDTLTTGITTFNSEIREGTDTTLTMVALFVQQTSSVREITKRSAANTTKNAWKTFTTQSNHTLTTGITMFNSEIREGTDARGTHQIPPRNQRAL